MPAFSSFEHASFNIEIPNVLTSAYQVTLSSGAKLPLAMIIALAGDYYGVPEKPISLGSTPADRKERFLAAFNTLDKAPREDVTNLIKMINEQREAVTNGLRNGKSEVAVMDNLNFKDTIESIEFTKANYLPLAEHNLDHFNETAVIAYSTGHELALQTARDAAKETNAEAKSRMIDKALMYEAFACHFLTDLFAAGHMRTPRKALYDKFGSEIGALLSLFMHDEDGIQYANNHEPIGISVRNKFGIEWMAFGDSELFEKYSSRNREMCQQAVYAAFNSVYLAYHPQAQLPNLDVMMLIPIPIENNFSALFRVNAGKLEYRVKLDDINSKEYRELTVEKVPEILAFYALKNAENTTLGKKVTAALRKMNTDEKKLDTTIGYIENNLFQPRPNQNGNNKRASHRCPCSML